jgi:SPP1 gp7 family putative phage head morphogenesis protein
LDRRTDVPAPTFSWLDAWQQWHSSRFTVAKSAGFDMLNDISDAVDAALKKGTTQAEFNRRLIPILQDKGWWGKAEVVDPLTGETKLAQLGSLRRLETIFNTNMRMSYAAGRWTAIQRVKADRPYLRYMHTASRHPRPEHLAWNGVTLPVDDPWWDTHYPPNGWGCKCSVVTLSERQFGIAQAKGDIVTEAPAMRLLDFVNGRTGERLKVPAGIDPGFGYNVGQAFLAAVAGVGA